MDNFRMTNKENNPYIQTNCELPACLLERSEELNDYDFILFHLFQKDKTYREYFSKVMKEGKRMTIFDNSAYEFYRDGGFLDVSEFCEAVEEFNPTYFIVPDVLMDSVQTFGNFVCWKNILPGYKRMVVPQGRSFKEWLDCYRRMLEGGGFDYVGIPFHNDFFLDLGTAVYLLAKRKNFRWNDDMAYAQGRCYLLQYLNKFDLVDRSKKYHLLGSHWAEELNWIRKVNEYGDGKFNWISSIDTSFPISKGIAMRDLTEGEKEKFCIDEYFHMDFDPEQIDKIVENIKEFRGHAKDN